MSGGQIVAASIGAAFGVYANYYFDNRNSQTDTTNEIVVSAGIGSIFGTGIYTLINNKGEQLFLIDSIVGATGAMIGCAAGQYIVYDNVSTPGPIVTQSARPILLIGGFAALGAGAAIAIEQYVTQSASDGAIR